MNNETIDIIIADKAKGELRDFILQIQEADKAFLNLDGTVKSFNKQAVNVKLPKDLNEVLKESDEIAKKVNTTKKQSIEIEEKIQRTKRTTAKRTQEEITNQGILRRNATRYAKANSALSTSYEKLSAKLSIMKRRYKDLAVNQLNGNKLTKAQQRELKRLERQIGKTDAALKKVDKSVGESFRNVGNYKSAWKGLGNVVRASIAAFGIYSGIQIAQSIYSDIKAIDGMNKALKQVTETQASFNRAKVFTQEVAEEAGVEIISLTKSYVKFLASAKTTNLTLEETENIFRQTAKAGAVLGLAQDDINGSFRALEQILSKGKVQAEEIRGQLGERLPGAFQILARSMGLTTQELSKQLELGNVISEEVLPGFARELEKTYSLDKIERVKTLTSEQARLGNEWTLLVESFENGEGRVTKALVSIMSALGSMLELIREANLELGSELESNAYKNQIERYKELGEEAKAYAQIDQDRALKSINNLESEKQRLERLTEQYENSVGVIQKYAGAGSQDNRDRKNRIEDINNALNTQNGIIKAATQTLLGYIPPQKESADTTKDQKDKAESLNKALIGSISYYEQLISQLKKTRDETATTNSEWGRQTKEIENLERELSKLKVTFEGITRLQSKGISDVVEKTDLQIWAEKELQEQIKKTGQISKTTTDQQIQDKLAIIEATRDQRDLEFDLANEANTALNDIANSFTQQAIERLDERQQRQDAYYDNLLENEQLSDEQRDQINRERAAKDKKLQEEKEQREREAFLIQQAFALAQIGIDLARTISAINLAAAAIDAVTFGIGGSAYRIANIPFAIATAGLQTAAVVAQTIPQFKEGHLSGTHEGLAIINDQKSPFYQEIVERVDGTKEIYSDRNQLINMNKGDKVHKASASETMILNHLLESVGGILPMQQNTTAKISNDQMDRLAGKVYKAMVKGQQGNKTDFDGLAQSMRKLDRISKI